MAATTDTGGRAGATCPAAGRRGAGGRDRGGGQPHRSQLAYRPPTGPPPAGARPVAGGRPARRPARPSRRAAAGRRSRCGGRRAAGRAERARLLELVRSGDTGFPRGGVYPTLEPLLPETFTPAQAAAATDLGLRIFLEADPAFTGSAAPAAFALLNPARRERARARAESAAARGVRQVRRRPRRRPGG